MQLSIRSWNKLTHKNYFNKCVIIIPILYTYVFVLQVYIKIKIISINYNNFSSSHASQCDAFYNDVASKH